MRTGFSVFSTQEPKNHCYGDGIDMSKKLPFYTLLYVEDCISKLKVFDSLEALERFVGVFTLRHLNNTDDNWIDATIDGRPTSFGNLIKVDE